MTPPPLLPPEAVAELRAVLMEARRRLLRTVATTEEELATLEAHQPGALTEDAPREAALAALARLSHQEQHELEEIYRAWARLEAGSYGACEGCGDTIPLARLRALPTARYCLSCQTRAEHGA